MCPFYDYECKECNYMYEELVAEGEKDSQLCPMCNRRTTRQLCASASIKNREEDGIVRRKKP
jgi:putative FmdB family regulatory protein